MRLRIIVSLCLVALAVLVFVLDNNGVFSKTDAGWSTLLVGIPLVIIAILALFSYIGAGIIVLGVIVHLLTSSSIPLLGLTIMVIGVVYGVAEPIVRAIRRPKQQNL